MSRIDKDALEYALAHPGDINELGVTRLALDLQDARAQLQRAVEGLKRYGRHRNTGRLASTCASLVTRCDARGVPLPSDHCDCGLDAALNGAGGGEANHG